MIPDWFPNADTWAAWAQWVTAAIAIGAAVFAYQQVKLARDTRERVAQPDVVVYMDHHAVRPYLDLVVKNFGQTAAYNVRLTLPPLVVAPYTSNLTGKQVTSLWLPESIAVLAPGQEWRTVWDSAIRREKYRERTGENLRADFVGSVAFDDKVTAGKNYSNPIALDADMFYNTTWIQQNKGKTVTDALYDIASTIKSYKHEDDGIWVYTVPGDEERHRRELEFIEQQRLHEAMLEDIGIVQNTETGTED